MEGEEREREREKGGVDKNGKRQKRMRGEVQINTVQRGDKKKKTEERKGNLGTRTPLDLLHL